MIHHPIKSYLETLGSTALVGGRDRTNRPKDCPEPTEETDWDYYLGIAAPSWAELAEECRKAANRLIDAGAEKLPKSGGPYGEDELIYGIFRFPASRVYGSTLAPADVILMSNDEMERRLPIWQRVRQTRIPKALKAERAWGQFWWVNRE